MIELALMKISEFIMPHRIEVASLCGMGSSLPDRNEHSDDASKRVPKNVQKRGHEK